MPLDAATVVKINKVKDKIRSEEARKQRSLNRLRMLKDDYKALVKEKLKNYVSIETFTKLEKIVNATVNVYKAVIDEIARLYTDKPQRVFTSGCKGERGGNEEQKKWIEDLYRKMKTDQKLKKTCKYVQALNECLLQVVYRKDEINFDILTPNVVSIVQEMEDITAPEVVVIDKHYEDSIGIRPLAPLRVVWTGSEHFILDENGEHLPINENDENPYKVMPFVYIHKEIPDCGFWDETTGTDLYDCNLIVGVLQTLIDYYFVWNSFKQLAIKSEQIPAGITVAPDKAIHLKGDEDQAFILDYTQKFKELIGALREYISMVAVNYGVDWNSIAMMLKEVSGTALKIKNSKLQRIWKDQEKVFIDAEQDLFTLIKVFYRVHYGKELKVELNVKFPSFEMYRDEKQELDNTQKELELNLKDLVMAFMERNKSIPNYEEAKAKLMEIINTNNELRGMVEEPLEKLIKEAV